MLNQQSFYILYTSRILIYLYSISKPPILSRYFSLKLIKLHPVDLIKQGATGVLIFLLEIKSYFNKNQFFDIISNRSQELSDEVYSSFNEPPTTYIC